MLWMLIYRAWTEDTSSRAEIRDISLPGRYRGCWTKLLRGQDSRDEAGQGKAAEEDNATPIETQLQSVVR